jgi:hypothetical protein
MGYKETLSQIHTAKAKMSLNMSIRVSSYEGRPLAKHAVEKKDMRSPRRK